LNNCWLFCGSPFGEEFEDGGLVVAGGEVVFSFELVGGLGVEELAVGGQDEQVRIAFGFGIVAEEGLIFVVGVPVDVDYDVVLFEGRGEGWVFVEGAIEQMAPGAPVAAYVEEDVLVFGLAWASAAARSLAESRVGSKMFSAAKELAAAMSRTIAVRPARRFRGRFRVMRLGSFGRIQFSLCPPFPCERLDDFDFNCWEECYTAQGWV